MTTKTKKIIFTILFIVAWSAILLHNFAGQYFFDISVDKPNEITGNIYTLESHGGKGYITSRQNLFLDVTNYTFSFLFPCVVLLGLYWKIFPSPFVKSNKAQQIITSAEKQYIGPRHTFLAIAAILCLFFGLHEIGGRLLIEVEGKIISTQTINHGLTYLIRGSDGIERQYAPGATDQSLPSGLQVGTYINKKKLELSWQKNGETINDFPLCFYLGACGIGIMLAYWGVSQWRLNSR